MTTVMREAPFFLGFRMTGVMAKRPGRGEACPGGETMSTPAAHASTLVCHELPKTERLSAVVRTFDALAPGESFELQSDHPPKAVLAHLQKERRGLFEWSPLQEGPEIWRTAVARRRGSATARRVAEALEWDHDRLDELERGAFAARAAGDLALATRLLHDFAHGLRRHIAFEEKLLFPAFEARSGAPEHSGPTFVMRSEHREIEQRLHDMETRFSDPQDPLTGAREAFHQLLHEHNVKEEQVLYPTTDRLLTGNERDELVGRIQAFTA
jgi:uncharacterized protein (DUF2249 family)